MLRTVDAVERRDAAVPPVAADGGCLPARRGIAAKEDLLKYVATGTDVEWMRMDISSRRSVRTRGVDGVVKSRSYVSIEPTRLPWRLSTHGG